MCNALGQVCICMIVYVCMQVCVLHMCACVCVTVYMSV